jgi:hypothetical protein
MACFFRLTSCDLQDPAVPGTCAEILAIGSMAIGIYIDARCVNPRQHDIHAT